MESYRCDLLEKHHGDCTECIQLAAAVPWSRYSLLFLAARHSDIRCLQTWLPDLPYKRSDPLTLECRSNMISNGDYGSWKSPLTEAILAKQPRNAALLLEHHADPNGFPIHLFSSFSSCFVRDRPMDLRPDTIGPFPPREKILANIESSQTGPLTASEIKARQSSRCRFWAEKDFPSLGSAFQAPITALEAAAKVGDKETFARLVEAGADTTAWTTRRHGEIPDAASPSFLTLSTPLQCAIQAENPAMVAYLLGSHHSPGYFPLSTITRSLNATMYALTLPAPSRNILDLLLSAANLSARTPIYSCHILHIAAATLNLDLFRHICEAVGADAKDLSTLAPTALGHTVLHIACLPRDDSCINIHSQKIYESIHEVRTLSDTWQPLKLRPHASPQPSEPASVQTVGDGSAHDITQSRSSLEVVAKKSSSQPPSANINPNEHAAQSSLIRHLLKTHHPSPLAALAAQDIHGNTPLHYLASARDFNEELWMWLCGMIKRWRKAEAASPPQQQQQQPPEAALSARRTTGTERRENTAASGYDPLIGIENHWGYSPAEFYLENVEARKEWGRERMPFWRDAIGGVDRD